MEPDPWRIVELLGLGLVGVLTWFAKDHAKRLHDVETSAVNHSEAEKIRTDLRSDISSARSELKTDMMQIRQEMTAQHARIHERLDTILDRLPARAGG